MVSVGLKVSQGKKLVFFAAEEADETEKGILVQEVSRGQREEHFGEEEEDTREHTR